MRRTSRPRLEQLEDRLTPTTWGLPWPIPQRLTLSFAPDGTQVGQQSSQLFETLSASFSNDQEWQQEILRAFQAWAIHTPINIVLVPDGGDPFGTTTGAQGSTLFGDIRLGGLELGQDVISVAVPYDASAGSWAGDVFVNSTLDFGGDYNLFAVMLHEAAHVLGIPHSHDPDSAVHGQYHPETELSADDIACVQVIYGSRLPDSWEGVNGNETIQTATDVSVTATSGVLLQADIGTGLDVDSYRLTFTEDARHLQVRINTSAKSLLMARVTLRNESGDVIWSGAESDLFGDDLSLELDRVKAGDIYFLQVDGGDNDPFGIGGYLVEIDGHSNSGRPPSDPGAPDADERFQREVVRLLSLQFGLGFDEETLAQYQADLFGVQAGTSPETALFLQNRVDFLPPPHVLYTHGDYLSRSAPDKFYQLAVPLSDQLQTLTLTLLSFDRPTFHPQVILTDANGQEIKGEMLVDQDGYSVYQFVGLEPGSILTAQIHDTDTTGGASRGLYVLSADFTPIKVELNPLMEGSLSQLGEEHVASFEVTQSSLVNLVVSALNSVDDRGGIRVEVRNQQGVLLSELVEVDQTRSLKLFLQPGLYTVSLMIDPEHATALSTRDYLVRWNILSDAIGPFKQDVILNPAPGASLPPTPGTLPSPSSPPESTSPSTSPPVDARLPVSTVPQTTEGSLSPRSGATPSASSSSNRSAVSLLDPISNPNWIGTWMVRGNPVVPAPVLLPSQTTSFALLSQPNENSAATSPLTTLLSSVSGNESVPVSERSSEPPPKPLPSQAEQSSNPSFLDGRLPTQAESPPAVSQDSPAPRPIAENSIASPTRSEASSIAQEVPPEALTPPPDTASAQEKKASGLRTSWLMVLGLSLLGAGFVATRLASWFCTSRRSRSERAAKSNPPTVRTLQEYPA